VSAQYLGESFTILAEINTQVLTSSVSILKLYDMDFLEDYQTNNITIQDLSKKYNISERKIRKVFKARGVKTKHNHIKKVTVRADKIFPIFLVDYLDNGLSMQHYADKYGISKFGLTLRLEKYFKLRRK
jgi:hypothetical protein